MKKEPRKDPSDLTLPVCVRLSPKLRAKLQKAAERRGMYLTAFIRHAAVLLANEPAGGERSLT